MIKEDTVLEALAQAGFTDNVSGVRITDDRIPCVIEVDPAQGGAIEELRQRAERHVKALDGVTHVSAIMTAKRAPKPDNGNVAPDKARAQIENLAPNIKHIIAVASGKGGVGKSTVAVNLAVTLAKMGYATGLMDADIYGPSAPMMLGLEGRPDLVDEKLQPHEAHGVKVMSMGFLVEDEAPMIWRGPMIQSALRQFLVDVNWGDLDILVVDMPPGTGDAQLTMAQKVPLAGAVIVSTPQDVALLDARKGLAMFRQVGVPVFGMVENMSVHVCSECGHEEHIFGDQGAQKEAARLGCDFLGALPLHKDVRICSDGGQPIVVVEPDGSYAGIFEQIAQRVTEKLPKISRRAQAS